MNFYNNQRQIKVVPIFFGIVVCIAIIINIYFSHKYKKIHLAYQFNGSVENVSYDIKGIASIVIQGVSYDLSDPNWDFDHNRIKKGDLMIKEKNSMIIKLIKSNGQIIVEGEDDFNK